MKILIIRFKMIGDVLLTSTIGNSLRDSFPNARIDYLMHSNSTALFEYKSSFDHVYGLTPAQRANPFKYLRTIWAISRNRYDLIIDATGTPKSEFLSLFARSARYRIGRQKNGRGFAYTHVLDSSSMPVNKIEQRLALLKPLREAGLSIYENRKINIALRSEEQSRMRSLLTEAGVSPNRPCFGIAVGAREPHKTWSIERMQQLITRCLSEFNVQIVLLAGLPHERAMAAALHQQMGNPEQVFASIPCANLRDLLSIIDCCDLFIGNEGGPRHMAEALGVPSFAIVSPSASKTEWLQDDSQQHRAIEWRDIDPSAHVALGSISSSDPSYQALYQLIEVDHVVNAVREMVKDLATFS